MTRWDRKPHSRTTPGTACTGRETFREDMGTCSRRGNAGQGCTRPGCNQGKPPTHPAADRSNQSSHPPAQGPARCWCSSTWCSKRSMWRYTVVPMCRSISRWRSPRSMPQSRQRLCLVSLRFLALNEIHLCRLLRPSSSKNDLITIIGICRLLWEIADGKQ